MHTLSSSENEPVKLKPVDDKATTFIIELMKAGKPDYFIVQRLVANGYEYDSSYTAVNELLGKVQGVRQQRETSNSGTDIGLGLVILIIGIVVTVASSNVIAYGAIIGGAIKLFRGISNASK